jgi:hypothetical protein
MKNKFFKYFKKGLPYKNINQIAETIEFDDPVTLNETELSNVKKTFSDFEPQINNMKQQPKISQRLDNTIFDDFLNENAANDLIKNQYDRVNTNDLIKNQYDRVNTQINKPIESKYAFPERDTALEILERNAPNKNSMKIADNEFNVLRNRNIQANKYNTLKNQSTDNALEILGDDIGFSKKIDTAPKRYNAIPSTNKNISVYNNPFARFNENQIANKAIESNVGKSLTAEERLGKGIGTAVYKGERAAESIGRAASKVGKVASKVIEPLTILDTAKQVFDVGRNYRENINKEGLLEGMQSGLKQATNNTLHMFADLADLSGEMAPNFLPINWFRPEKGYKSMLDPNIIEESRFANPDNSIGNSIKNYGKSFVNNAAATFGSKKPFEEDYSRNDLEKRIGIDSQSDMISLPPIPEPDQKSLSLYNINTPNIKTPSTDPSQFLNKLNQTSNNQQLPTIAQNSNIAKNTSYSTIFKTKKNSSYNPSNF